GASSVVTASGSPPKANISIGPYSALIFSQTPDALPQLTIATTNGAMNISWPSSYFEWVLYQSTSLTGTPTWVQVPPAQYQASGSAISINATPAGGSSFYRLQRK